MSARNLVAYIDGAACDGSVERDVLEPRGCDLVLAGCTTDDEVVEIAAGAGAILNGRYKMTAALFGRLPALRAVIRTGIGYDNIELDAATRAGVVVCNNPYAPDEVANHAFAMMLALNRKLVPLDRAVRAGTGRRVHELMPHTGRLAGQTLGLVSFGAIARAVARRAAGFDMRIVAFDPFVDPALAESLGVQLVSLPDLLMTSDYVSVHTPLSGATRGFIGAAELALMQPSAYVILTSRGGVVDEQALYEALRADKIAGAGIDVWEHEPPSPHHPLLELDVVVASPHMAYYSDAGSIEIRRSAASMAADVLDGTMPPSVVNPDVLASLGHVHGNERGR
jgi:D-3-phosphoglycerate dehydrogenase